MDVHAPHEPIHTARDFFLHLFTITVGLLIALGLEGLVEVHHHHVLLHQAETNLHDEILDNRRSLAKDEQQLTASEQSLTNNLKILSALKAHQTAAAPPNFNWYWNGMQSAAWDTARDTGAIALMSYDRAQAYSIVYGQQTYVDEQATVYIRDIYHSGAPLQGGRQLADLSPAEIDAMIAGTQQAIVDLKLLNDLARSLDLIYIGTDGKL